MSLHNLDQLKPCPFCGEVDIRIERKTPPPWGDFRGEDIYVIGCQGCRATFPFAMSPTSLVTSWNTRAQGDMVNLGAPRLLESVVATSLPVERAAAMITPDYHIIAKGPHSAEVYVPAVFIADVKAAVLGKVSAIFNVTVLDLDSRVDIPAPGDTNVEVRP